MGRYSFQAARVAQNAKRLLDLKHISHPPSWLQPVTEFPPSQILVRTQPVQHDRYRQSHKKKRARRPHMPQTLNYEEDNLREEFFRDHPWELARPRMLLENDGKDWLRNEWNQISQPGRTLDGESVVQRQMVLMGDGLSKSKAFDQARKEFYLLRHDAEVAARVQREEALATGAYFDMSQMEIGMQLENETFNSFRAWAKQQVVLAEQAKSAAYSGVSTASSQDTEADSDSSQSAAEIIGSPAEEPRNVDGGTPTTR